MVVVSGNWAKNVLAYPTPDMEMVISPESKMSAKAVLTCRPNSHPFQDRTLVLDQPVKVGRSVARARVSATNAIFDCKVLSRHHALLWYENGKFFLQDTKSSNGTFVNNTRLMAEAERHEVSSGDIVQFGVDVIENNRKVTHGCIIATLKLYLPDGKEAKASPSITESNTHVPLDELYKLHQIIQEATQREQCLESKLMALQSVVDDARKSAEESWQAYVGEERLLSRVSALETQLQQANKNWGEDKFREEIDKLHEDNASYQIAAKQALEKLHGERLQAIAVATEQERCRISAEQEIIITKEQLVQAQQELEELAQRLTEEQTKSEEERIRLENQQSRLDDELEKVEKLQLKLMSFVSIKDTPSLYGNLDANLTDRHIMYNDDLKKKEGMLAENEISETEMNKTNGDVDAEPDHISLTVAPVSASEEQQTNDSLSLTHPETIVEERHVFFNLPESPESPEKEKSEEDDEKDDDVDSKTLKYKYQSAQNELKKKIEILESVLESNNLKLSQLDKALSQEKDSCKNKREENEKLRQEFLVLQQKFKENREENEKLRDRVKELDQNDAKAISSNVISYEQFVSLEEEIVLLKERYAQTNDEKLKLQHELETLKEQYNKLRNTSYDKMYFYIAPLILMILYLVISAMIS